MFTLTASLTVVSGLESGTLDDPVVNLNIELPPNIVNVNHLFGVQSS